MEAYLDNAATTRVRKEVINLMQETMEQEYGNPSSLHQKGVLAEAYVRDAKDRLAKELKCEPKEIVFTSGGTESNNMALLGGAFANRRAGMHIISTRIEHASVYNPLLWLEQQGFQVDFLDVDANGIVDLEQLQRLMTEETILVSVMWVNNEMGAIQPVECIGKLVKEINPKCLFHVDAIQAFGKLRTYPKKNQIDLMSISGHKFQAPKGIGALFVKDKTKIVPIIHGGGQQKGMRSGTENVPGIAGLGLAASMAYQNLDVKIETMKQCKERLIAEATAIEGVTSNSGEAPHIVSLSFQGIRSEVLLHALEERGVYVSSGSACSSNHPSISGTLQAIGVEKELLDSTLRFSLSYDTTMEEIAYACEQLRELLPVLRRFVRK